MLPASAPRGVSTTTVSGVWEAAEWIGFPLIVKPIHAGSADTYRVGPWPSSTTSCRCSATSRSLSVEEFVDGEEFTYDTVCAAGQVLFEHMLWYRPRPLQRLHEWISPSCICCATCRCPTLPAGRRMGVDVLTALGFQSGFTHMEVPHRGR